VWRNKSVQGGLYAKSNNLPIESPTLYKYIYRDQLWKNSITDHYLE